MQIDQPMIISVKLNNFVHRIDCKTTIITIANQHGCQIKRIRRSKNWILTGTSQQLNKLSYVLKERNISWIAVAIDKAQPQANIDLALLLQSTPSITVNQLMAKTGCTLIEARNAIDVAEGFNLPFI